MNTQIFILHHTPAISRKQNIQHDLNAVNLPYPIVWIEKFLPHEIDTDINYTIRQSELSLSLKHQYALQQIVQSNIQYGIIFEDDIDLRSIPNIQKFIEQSIIELEYTWGDILWIGDVWVGKYIIPQDKKNKNKISYFSNSCYSRCTHAYIITQRGAKLVLDNYHYNLPIDHLYNEIITNKVILPGWTEPGLIQKTAEGIWSTLI
jgi:hypothetical protein